MRASVSIQKAGKRSKKQRTVESKQTSVRSLTRRNSRSKMPSKTQMAVFSEDGTKMNGEEALLTHRAVEDYKKKKNHLMKNLRVFGDSKIATIDESTLKRTQQVASLLGNTREAREIQEQFKRMIEVPQEDFSLENFKELTAELRNKVQKPAPIYI